MSRTILLAGAVAATLLVGGVATAQTPRNFINVVGSSTVYPFTTKVAERFGRGGKFRTPKVESTGTGGGVRLFCSGVGVQFPDIVNASRRLKPSEFEICQKNGVTQIVEVPVGFDGIVLAESRRAKPLDLTRRHVYLALAKQVPDRANPARMVPNPHRTWRDIDPALPAVQIEILGPPPTSGTRDSFNELYMEAGCRTFAPLEALRQRDERRFKQVCHTYREDGVYVEAGENDNLIAQKIEQNPGALGIFGYTFLAENKDQLRGTRIEGVLPDYDSIAAGRYPASRQLYLYVKRAHVGVVPGMREFLAEYLSDRALNEEDGYLGDLGLVPLPPAQLVRVRADTTALKPFKP